MVELRFFTTQYTGTQAVERTRLYRQTLAIQILSLTQ